MKITRGEMKGDKRGEKITSKLLMMKEENGEEILKEFSLIALNGYWNF